jgi:2-iminobutanoate/2-iminopropanoate deaminase
MSDQVKTAISTKEAPAAIGPYSQAVRVGDMLFASGQVGLDPASGQIVAGGVTEQTVRVLENGEDDRVFEVDGRLCGDERGLCEVSCA